MKTIARLLRTIADKLDKPAVPVPSIVSLTINTNASVEDVLKTMRDLGLLSSDDDGLEANHVV